MISAALMKKIMATEEIRLVPYPEKRRKPDGTIETTGNFTVGIGHKIIRGDYLDPNKPITAKKAKELFLKDIIEHQKTARNFIGKEYWDKLSQNRQDALTEMAFNAPIVKFKKLRDRIREGDFDAAGLEMLYSGEDEPDVSLWYSQNPSRVTGIYRAFAADTPPQMFNDAGEQQDIDKHMEIFVNRQISSDLNIAKTRGINVNNIQDIRHGLSPKQEEKLIAKGKVVDKAPRPFRLSEQDISRILNRPNSKNKKATRKDSDMDRDSTVEFLGVQPAALKITPENAGDAVKAIRERMKTDPQREIDNKEGRRKAREAEELVETLKANESRVAGEKVPMKTPLGIHREKNVTFPNAMQIPTDVDEIRDVTGVADFSQAGNQRII